MAKITNLTDVQRRYSPEQTQLVRAQTVSEIVAAHMSMLERAPDRIDLSNIDAVQDVANDLMRRCAAVGCLPTMELFAASLGFSRRGLYDFLQRHSNTPVSQYIDRLRTAWAGMRIAAADRGAVPETTSIFVLLNSALGFSNQHTIELAQTRGPFEPAGPEKHQEIVDIIAALPDPDEK